VLNENLNIYITQSMLTYKTVLNVYWNKLKSICNFISMKMAVVRDVTPWPTFQRCLLPPESVYATSAWSRVLFDKLIIAQLGRLLWNPYVHCRFHKSPPLVPILSSWVQATHSHTITLRSILILSSRIHLGLTNGFLPSGVRPKFWRNFSSFQ
jgi:hypothetical protein